MIAPLSNEARHLLEAAISRLGLRATRQRELVFRILLDKRDHPTADDVYARAKAEMASISLATVYNCLETLVRSGLVRSVNYDREPTRYCPNLTHHAHFHDQESGRVYDVDLPEDFMDKLKSVLPEEYEADSVELYFHGRAGRSRRMVKS